MSHEPEPLPSDLIGLALAAKLIPCARPGGKVHLHTIYRWIRRGKLRSWRRGRYHFVSRKDVLALHERE